MDIKTYEALNMRDAIKSVKKELGEDAVILSVRNKALTGKSGAKTVEVKATSAVSSRSGASTNSSSMPVPTYDSEAISGMDFKLRSLADSMPRREQVESINQNIRELKSLLIESLRVHDESFIRDVPIPIRPVEEQLRLAGVSSKIIVELISYLRSLPPEKVKIDRPEMNYRAHALKWIMKRIQVASKWSPRPGSAVIHALIGAPGAGKTTLIAKLASHLHRAYANQVLVVSFDKARLAASEQLRVMCKVIGVEFVAVQDVSELKRVSQKRSDIGIILLDTGGISTGDSQSLSEMEQLRELDLAIDFHLVLSSNDKPSLQDQQISFFCPVGIQSLAFTRLDESSAYADILNASVRWSLPVGYISNGQRVPDDIERAGREKLAERLLG